MNNPYEKLFLNPDCTDEELQAKYAELKAQYSEDRFLDGEAGKQGAIHLTELEEAYAEIQKSRREAAQSERFGADLDGIDAMIKAGEIDAAQAALDSLSTRGGRWHYLQAIIYYKRNWYQDSLQQLNIAISLEPDNEQFKKSRDMLERNMQAGPQSDAAGGAPGPQPQPTPMDDSMGMATCCNSICCASCCCDMLRCFGCG